MKYTTKNDQETFALGRKLASWLKGGEVIGLIGDLGAGKTVFTKGLAAGLGVKKVVNSPTFVIMKVYNAQGIRNRASGIRKTDSFPNSKFQIPNSISNLIHIDAYRLTSCDELTNIGAKEYFGRPDSITVIEWADRVLNILPPESIKISIKQEKNTRQIEIKN